MLRSAILIFTIYCLSVVPTAQGMKCLSCRGINCLRTTLQNKSETCQDNLDNCVTIFEKFAVVAKGCSMNIPIELRKKCNDKENPECQKCFGDLCNNMGRIDFKCYQCDERDKNSGKCDTPTQCSAPTAPNSYCYTRWYNGLTARGCSLNVKDQLGCLSDSTCTLCLADDGEGCNSKQMSKAGVSKISSVFGLVSLCILITSYLRF